MMVQVFMEAVRKEQRLFDKLMLKKKQELESEETVLEALLVPGPVGDRSSNHL